MRGENISIWFLNGKTALINSINTFNGSTREFVACVCVYVTKRFAQMKLNYKLTKDHKYLFGMKENVNLYSDDSHVQSKGERMWEGKRSDFDIFMSWFITFNWKAKFFFYSKSNRSGRFAMRPSLHLYPLSSYGIYAYLRFFNAINFQHDIK